MVAEGYAKNFAHWKTIYSSVTSYKKKSNGKWKKEKAQIQANIFYVLRNEVCGVDESGNEIDFGHKKHVQSKKTRSAGIGSEPYAIGNLDDTYTINICTNQGTTVSTSFILNGCQ